MIGEVQLNNLAQAKARCRHCFALVDKDEAWWCSEADCPIQEVTDCKEWETNHDSIVKEVSQ